MVKRSTGQLRASRACMIAAAFMVASVLMAAPVAQSAEYPSRPVRIIHGFAAGGPTDILSRIIADQLSKSLGGTVIVENRVGAGGNIAATAVARADPDGYTLLVGGTNYAIGRSWHKNLQFDIVKDFQIVSTISKNPNVLVVHPDSGWTNVNDILRKARAEPDRLTFASSGVGTVVHLAAEIFKAREKVEIRHIPYNGATPAEIDLMSARVDMMFDSLPVAMPFIKDNKLRAIGVTSKDRSIYAPEIPTLAEQGLEGFDVTSWYALWAPAGVPKEIVEKINRIMVDGLATPEVKARLAALQAEPAGRSPEAASKFQDEEIEMWTKAVGLLGPRPD